MSSTWKVSKIKTFATSWVLSYNNVKTRIIFILGLNHSIAFFTASYPVLTQGVNLPLLKMCTNWIYNLNISTVQCIFPSTKFLHIFELKKIILSNSIHCITQITLCIHINASIHACMCVIAAWGACEDSPLGQGPELLVRDDWQLGQDTQGNTAPTHYWYRGYMGCQQGLSCWDKTLKVTRHPITTGTCCTWVVLWAGLFWHHN